MFINLYLARRGPSIFLDKSGRLKEHCVTRQKNATILEPLIEFRETSIFLHSPLDRIPRNDLFSTYFSRNIAATIRTTANAPTNSTCVYNLSEVKFLGDKKRTNERFLSGSLENRLNIFVTSLSFELSQLFLYLWRFVFTCIHATL